MVSYRKAQSNPILKIHFLGEFRLQYGDQILATVNTARMQAFLAYLVLYRQSPQMRQHLAFTLWPESTEKQARTNLRNLLFLLRRALPRAEHYLMVDARTLQWNPDAEFYLDVDDFEYRVGQGDFEGAVEVYQGDLIPSCYDDWIIAVREVLRSSYVHTLDTLVDQRHTQGDYPAAIHYAQIRLRQDVLHEDLYLRLMKLHVKNGDTASALRVFHSCDTNLQRELGVEPGASLREYYQQLLNRQTEIPAVVAHGHSKLVGRDLEFQQLQDFWRLAVKGKSLFLVISGEAGIGKTRLAEELLAWVNRQGFHFAQAQCYPSDESITFAPIAEFLRGWPLPALPPMLLSEIGRLRPDVFLQGDVSQPNAMRESWQRQVFFEALARAFLDIGRPALLFIDDLQWCDQSTIEWLRYLLHYDRNVRLMVLATIRVESIEPVGVIPDLYADMRRAGRMFEISLEPLDRSQSIELATSHVENELSAQYLETLYRETEGNPLFIVESLRAAQGIPHSMGKVKAAIEQRLAQLSKEAREVADVAAVIGRQFRYPVLARVVGDDEDVLVRALDELWLRYIVREQGTDAYDFSHNKIRAAVYDSLSAARRRLLHQKVADALEAIHQTDLDAVSMNLAVHYAKADRPEKAIAYYLRAADASWRVYANVDALASLRSAIEQLAKIEDAPLRSLLSVQLYERQGDILNLIGLVEQAMQSYRAVLEGGNIDIGVTRARIERKIGSILTGIHDDEAALLAFDYADEALDTEALIRDEQWWHEWIEVRMHRMIWHYWSGKWQGMQPLIEESQPVLERYGTKTQIMTFHRNLMRFGLRRDRYVASQETLDHTMVALELARETNDLYEIADGQFAYGFALLWHGDLREAAAELESALEMAERIEHLVLRLQSLAYLMLAQRMLGRQEDLESTIRRAEPAFVKAERKDYLGITRGNQAWIAWRAGKLEQAEQSGNKALEIWGQAEYPFKWPALFPLIAISVSRGNLTQAMEYCRKLLEPHQVLLPEALNHALENAIESWDHGKPANDVDNLEIVIDLAQQWGYL